MTRPINPRFVEYVRSLGYVVTLPAPDTAHVTCPRCGVTWRFGPELVDFVDDCRRMRHLGQHPAACRERFPDGAGGS